MKRIASLTMAFAMLAFLMLGAGACSFGVSYYGTYADADKYSTGNFNYEAGMVTSVEINWVDGSIELIQSDASTLSVSESGGTLDAEEQMHYYINGGTLVIHYCQSGYNKSIDGGSKNLRVEIPRGIDLDIDNVSADISGGTIEVKDLGVTNVSGKFKLGEITAKEVDVETVSGSVEVGVVNAAGFSADSISGNIDIESIKADDIDVQAVSGDTKLILAKKCDIEVSGISGAVKITLPKDTGAKVDFSSVSGRMNTEREYEKNTEKYTFGAGEIKIDIETVSGNVYIY